MDQSVWLALGALTVVVLVAAVLIMRRSWGDFPGRAGPGPGGFQHPPAMSAAPPLADEPDETGSDEVFGPIEADGLVEVRHPLVRRSVEAAMQRGGSVARYLAERGGRYYFDLSRIEESDRRERAAEVIEEIRAGRANLPEVMRLVQELTGRE
jgi:hypothetical protein